MKAILLSGLPASGKTSWAKTHICEANKDPNDLWEHISRDAIRLDLGINTNHNRFSRKAEKLVLAERDRRILAALENNVSIVVDETFVNPKQLEHVQNLISVHFPDAEVEHKTMETPLQECIKRDLHRGKAAVGAGVIRDHARRRAEKPPACISGVGFIYICDIDGTLAITPPGASHYDRDYTKDIPNQPVIDFVLNTVSYDWRDPDLFLVSGRKERYREQTEKWLANNGIAYAELFMRPSDSNERDYIIKRRIYDEHIRGRHNVIAVFDDRDQTVDEWRQLGLLTLQVADGGF